MSAMPPSRRAFLHGLGALLVLAGCADEPPLPSSPEADSEEREEFHQEILSDIDKVDTFLQKTLRGVNLSEFTLGWFTMILLNELCAQDLDLYNHIHADERNVETYLRTAFQSDPKAEIAFMGALARKGRRSIRLSARYALEMLTTIPDVKASSALQAQSRKELASALYKLRAALVLVAAEASPPKAQ
jgi:hypothetical protein